MPANMIDRLKKISLWHLLWLSLVLSEFFTAIMNTVMGLIWWGRIDLDLVLIGTVDAFVVGLIVSIILISIFKYIRDHERVAGEELSNSEKKFRMLFELATDAIFIMDTEGNFIDVNRTAYERLGYTKEEMMSMHISELDPPEFSEKVPERLGCLVREGQAVFESAHREKDGTVMPVEINARIIDFGKGKVIFSFIRDITERKHNEDELERQREWLEDLAEERTLALMEANKRLQQEMAEKTTLQAEAMRTGHLAALGELAAGVAHEINNPINSIINYAQLLLDRHEISGREDEIAVRIIKEGDRIANIVKALLSFASRRQEEKEPAYVHEIISETLALTESQIKKDGIELKIAVPSRLPWINVHSHQLIQVFLNIISNARYALNKKYSARHKDKVLEITGNEVMIDGDQYVRTVFLDLGTGMPEHVLDKVVEPFFSTKPPNEGTGLGLSISCGIIRDHGGSLKIESREGEFTRLIIDLPAGKNN